MSDPECSLINISNICEYMKFNFCRTFAYITVLKSVIYTLAFIPMQSCCNSFNKFQTPDAGEIFGFEYSNSVSGHREESLIVGKFNGSESDTLWIDRVENRVMNTSWEESVKYYLKSNNPRLSGLEIYGCASCEPKLVYEGDVDGDGKDEWGYLHTWTTSQWRYYRIYNYDDITHSWRFLYYNVNTQSTPLLDTNEFIRGSGVEIVENGPRGGLIRINYICNIDGVYEIRDTLVAPTYTPISEDVW
ncbi:MAG: hypothetical protein NC548_50500 [Lachnospiraceae bacterium]|nr:hypothetical protein [Lachnospiraceae bacterium]